MPQMKIYLDKDEWYPVFSLSRERRHSGEKEIEVDPKEVRAIEKAYQAFLDAQSLMESWYEQGKWENA